ncbi:hypothetical protein [Streptomyces uncialis]|uniref:hypothetical protein n=1 Tax=Streptomyces uncialis TaxID=1048205 RepID=UPI00386F1048|nr:hypothetical protein OG924_36025 [Streptomyces uncialis]
MDTMTAIRRKLGLLRAADPGLRLFGAGRHRHRSRPVAGTDTVERVERLAGVRLPEDHREFVTSVADGAPGPYHGVMSLDEALGELTRSRGTGVLGADSPLTGDVDLQERLGGGDDDRATHLARLGADPEYAAGLSRLRTEYLGTPWTRGRLPLAEHGCGELLFLVLRGPRRGTVWVDSVLGGTGLYCLETDFLTWYSRWLDDALARAEQGMFDAVDARYPFLRYGDNPRYRMVVRPGVS